MGIRVLAWLTPWPSPQISPSPWGPSQSLPPSQRGPTGEVSRLGAWPSWYTWVACEEEMPRAPGR